MAKHKKRKQEHVEQEPKRRHPEEDPDGNLEEVNLVQTSMWVKALQEDLDFRRAGGEKVGAHAQQLMCCLLELQPGADPEAWQSVEALLATYVHEAADEARGDLADAFAETWKHRLQVLLLGEDVVLAETQESSQGLAMEEVFRELECEKRIRAEKRRARAAQRADDEAMRQAMAQGEGSGSSASTERIQKRVPVREQHKQVKMRRILINGVE